jgi:hypothetical protein
MPFCRFAWFGRVDRRTRKQRSQSCSAPANHASNTNRLPGFFFGVTTHSVTLRFRASVRARCSDPQPSAFASFCTQLRPT